MKRFNSKGMMIIPNPIREEISGAKKVFVASKLFCPNGHNIISERASFNGHSGIVVKVQSSKGEGSIALSPIYGEKTRVAIDVDLQSGETVKLLCPQCSAELPAYSSCVCGASLTAFFLSAEADFSDCIGICNRIDCSHAHLIKSGKMISLSMIDAL